MGRQSTAHPIQRNGHLPSSSFTQYALPSLPGHVPSMESRYVSEAMPAALFSMIGLLINLIDCGSARGQVQATGRREDQGAAAGPSDSTCAG